MGELIPFPIQENVHWNGRSLNDEEIKYFREFLLSVARRIRIKRMDFSGVNLRGNDIKVMIDQLFEKRIILAGERQRIYQKLSRL